MQLQVPRIFKDKPMFWMAFATALVTSGVFLQEFQFLAPDEVSLYFWTRLPITILIWISCYFVARYPYRAVTQNFYAFTAYLYTFQGEYFRPNYLFAYIQYALLQALFFRQSKTSFLLIHGSAGLAFCWWMDFNMAKNQQRLLQADVIWDYSSMVLISLIMSFVMLVQVNKARQEKDRSQSRFLLVGKQAVNIVHDLKSLASAPQIYLDFMFEQKHKIDPETEKVLLRLNEDLSNMVKKTKDLYSMVQLKEHRGVSETVNESLDRALSFLSNRMKKVEVVRTGEASLQFPQGYLELIFLNLFYNSLDAWSRTQHLIPKLHIDLKPNIIIIHDNAGGADEDVIRNFNAQREVNGRGLGLYLIRDAAQTAGLEVTISNALLDGQMGLKVEILSG